MVIPGSAARDQGRQWWWPDTHICRGHLHVLMYWQRLVAYTHSGKDHGQRQRPRPTAGTLAVMRALAIGVHFYGLRVLT